MVAIIYSLNFALVGKKKEIKFEKFACFQTFFIILSLRWNCDLFSDVKKYTKFSKLLKKYSL